MILYHRTKKENLCSIIKNGLSTKYSKFWEGKRDCIYLSITPRIPFGNTLFSVKVDGLNITKVSWWEYVCWENIPAKNLTIKLTESTETNFNCLENLYNNTKIK